MDDTIAIKVSAAWARHLFACSLEHILAQCHGACCEGSSRVLVSLLPAEAAWHIRAGHNVRDGFLQPAPDTGKCPHKLPNGLCALHGTSAKPFGCIASPFTVNPNATLVIRHRYSRMRCHGCGAPAYRVFGASLVMLFGPSEAKRITSALDDGSDDLWAAMPEANLTALRYLDALKTALLARRDAPTRA